VNAIAGADTAEALIAEAAGKALAQAAPHRSFTSGAEEGAAVAARHWALAVEMGWPGILIPEAQGGLGIGLPPLAVLAEEMGRHLFCGPFAATAVLTPMLFPALGGAIARGEIVAALAAPTADGALVEHPALATHVLRLGDAGGTLVEKHRALRSADRQPFDVTCPVAEMTLGRAGALECPTPDAAALAPFHVAIAAELVGVAQGAMDRAVAHVKQRRQFGAVIGSFQAIKHKLADAAILVTNARLAVRHAAVQPEALAVHAARVLAADAAFRACGDCIQVQGGLGFSWENDAHLYLKRARRLAALLGSPMQSRRLVADRFIAQVLSMPEAAV